MTTAGTATRAANKKTERNRFDIGYPDPSIGPDVDAQIPRLGGGRRVSLELVIHYPNRVITAIRSDDWDGQTGYQGDRVGLR